jgi:hypothetical protein
MFQRSSAPPVWWVSSAGKTIASVPQSSLLKPMCVEEGDVTAPLDESPRVFKIRLADSEGQRRSAGFLVQQRYAWRGYQTGSAPDGRPNRITLAASDHDEIIATISVGLDSSNGMFVDKLYRPEVDRIRDAARKVCEFTKLAVESSIRSKMVLATLFHIAFIYVCRIHRCTDLLVEVNPRHVLFYKQMLGFTEWGPERLDPRVRAIAVLLRLDLAFAQQQIVEMGGRIELPAARRSLYPYFFSPREESGIESRLRSLGQPQL